MGSRPGEISVSPTLIVRLVILALSVLGASPAAHAQPSPTIPRIGILGRTPRSAGSFPQALRDLGYREGQTIAIESRWTEGQLDRLPDPVAELVRLQPDLLGAFAIFYMASLLSAQPSPLCVSAQLLYPISSHPATIPRDGRGLGDERACGHGSCPAIP
jgi:hypothetical protein